MTSARNFFRIALAEQLMAWALRLLPKGSPERLKFAKFIREYCTESILEMRKRHPELFPS